MFFAGDVSPCETAGIVIIVIRPDCDVFYMHILHYSSLLYNFLCCVWLHVGDSFGVVRDI